MQLVSKKLLQFLFTIVKIEAETVNRLVNLAWCVCNFCIFMPMVRVCHYCAKLESVLSFLDQKMLAA